MSEKDEAVMFMAESNSIEEARYRRAIVEYCEKFTDEVKSVTIKTFNQVEAIFKLGLGIETKLSTVIPMNDSSGLVNEIKKREVV